VLVLLALVVINSRRGKESKTAQPEPAAPPAAASEKTETLTPDSQPVVEVKIEAVKAETIPPPPDPAPHVTEVTPPAAEAAQPEKAKKPRQTTRRDHGFDIVDIEGIGKKYAVKLHDVGIYHTSELLEAGATPKGRKELAEKTGISHTLILEWVNLADLFRVKGIGEEYSDLLEEAGIDTVVELAHRNAENLHAKIVEVNDAKRLVRRLPSQAAVEGWIAEAKKLPRVIEY